jgi:hypothetical protein
MLLWLLAAATPLAQYNQQAGGVGPLSETAFVSWFGATNAPGALRLQAMVIWRAPQAQWFEPWGNDQRGVTLGDPRSPTTKILEFRMNPDGTSVTVAGERVELNETNVVLVEVDGRDGNAVIVDRLRIDNAMLDGDVIPQQGGQPFDPAKAFVRKHPRLASFAGLN